VAYKTTRKQFDGACWCLIVSDTPNKATGTVLIRYAGQKAWHVYDQAEFSSSGPASLWANTIQPGIECVKVVMYVRE
jgi:hypothetical protein